MIGFISFIDRYWGFERARAHCDIPCGIYDPITAQIAALTVVRMDDLLAEQLKSGTAQDAEFYNRVTRLVKVKDEHGERVKHDIRVIWGDFIKQEHLDKHPELNGLVHDIMLFGSKARQTADREQSVKLLDAVNRFAEIFWQIKGVQTKRAKAPYPPNLEFVYPQL